MPENGQVGSCRMDFHATIAVPIFHLDHISSILRHCRNLSEGRKGRLAIGAAKVQSSDLCFGDTKASNDLVRAVKKEHGAYPREPYRSNTNCGQNRHLKVLCSRGVSFLALRFSCFCQPCSFVCARVLSGSPWARAPRGSLYIIAPVASRCGFSSAVRRSTVSCFFCTPPL